MAFFRAMPWHSGEEKAHTLMRVPQSDNPTASLLTQNAARRVAASPTIALGTVDDEDNVWCTIWGGDLPIAQQVANGVIGVKARVDASFDPVVQALYGGQDTGEILKHEERSAKMVSGLSIHLEDRDRVKLFGKMVAGCLDADADSEAINSDNKEGTKTGKTGLAQLVLHISQSLGNCPKYINKRTITSHPSSRPQLISSQAHLSPEAISHIQSCDVFFVASRGPEDMDCNHRGGTSGFLRVQPSTSLDDGSSPSVLVWPEYSGNNLYQTLGNIMHSPRIGLCVPNLITGDVLYLTGTAEVLLDRAATTVISKTRLAVRFTVSAFRFVREGLLFRGEPCTNNKDRSSSNPNTTREITDGMSPYNPRLRYLTSELDSSNPSTATADTLPPDEYRKRGAPYSSQQSSPTLTATLIRKSKLTPTITRYGFRISSTDHRAFDPKTSPLWKPGQYVALDFSDELYMGYSHMADDDPTSLNDDFVRTFTVASKYTGPASGNASAKAPEFDIVVRNVGTVTRWLSRQNERAGMAEIGVVGFGGEFRFDVPAAIAVESGQSGSEKRERARNVFIAAGIGITPLLGQLAPLSSASSMGKRADSDNHDDDGVDDALTGLTILWTLQVRDINLALDVMPTIPKAVKKNVRVFVTGTQQLDGDSEEMVALEKLEKEGEVEVLRRRLGKEDLEEIVKSESEDRQVANWFVCTAPAMRRVVQEWLGGRTIVFENFDY